VSAVVPSRGAPIDVAEQLLQPYLGRRPRSLVATSAGAGEMGPVILLSELLSEVCLDGDVDREDLRLLIDAIAEVAATPGDAFRLQLAHCVASGRALLELPPESAIDVALRVLFLLAPARQVSLWEVEEDGEPVCSSHAGSFPSKRTPVLARRVLQSRSADHTAGLLVGVSVGTRNASVAALVAQSEPSGRGSCDVLLRQFAPLLAAQLERRGLTKRAATTERLLAEASERRLSRLAFDIHDGALQNVAGVTGDLAMLRCRLREALPEGQARLELLGCADDLEARLSAVDTELRDLAHSMDSPAGPRGVPFTRMLRQELAAFARRTDIRPGIEVEGDFEDLTESQRIALWRIVQESLANAREHSCAREVIVKALATQDRLHVEVTDDGRGFDVRDTLLDAAQRGRLGLVGVGERVRLLGGRCEVRSKPGGPTTISVTLPRWRPQT
jgi:signal transduction histidine kinase